MYKIAIDGPSASGKTEVAKALGSTLGILVVDTGAIYRAIALFCQREKIDIYDDAQVIEHTKDIEVHLRESDVFLNGENVSRLIRTKEVSMITSVVAQIPQIREKVTEIQRKIANTQSVVMQGRDITSVVLPDADLKIYLNATPIERAKRRQRDLAREGENLSLEEVLDSINKRDESDMTRAISPLVKTEDSIQIDTTNLSLNEVVDRIIFLVKERGLDSSLC